MGGYVDPGSAIARGAGAATVPAPEKVYVRCFGVLTLEGLGCRLEPRDLGLKPKQIFEVLLVARGHVVSKHRIADLLWGEMLPRDFVATVESHVSVLRRRLREALPASERAIVTEPGGYRLDPECVRVDLDDFDELLTIAATSSNGVAEGHLMEAIGLIRGDVFEDEPYSVWAESLRGHYRPRAVGALLDAARHALARADFDRALELAQRVLAMDTEVEAAYQIEMIGYYRLGRQEEALRAFGRCQKTLAYDLAVEPLEMTMELAWAIRHHDGAQMSEWSLNAPIWLNGRRP